MSGSRVGIALRQLSDLFHGRRVSERSDSQLLDRFLSDRDETAFAALVQRHGNLVLGVCRRILGNTHDAEDAFQASFLVLIRSAAAIRRQESLASWLYGVAHRTALKARIAAARRRTHEGQAAMPSTASTEPTWEDLRPVLDEELSRLPEHYRTPLVLCYLEGKSKEEAARELDCPMGTVSSRLVRGRDLLRGRLARRGVGLSVLGMVALLEQNTAAAAVSAGLALATLQAALSLAAGKPADVSASILTLTEGVLQAMLMSRIRLTVLAVAVPVLLLAGGAVTYAVLAQEKGEKATGNAATRAEEPRTDGQLLQGTWRRVTKSEATGRVLDETTYIFKGDKYWYIPNGREIGPLDYRLDSTKTPKAIDLQFPRPVQTNDGREATINPCIYQLDGDTLKLGQPKPGDWPTRPDLKRPTGFDDAITQILKREPPGAALQGESRFVKDIVDPQPTLDLVVDRSRLLRLKEAPKKFALADQAKVTYTWTDPKELLLTGKAVGKTDLTLWFATGTNSEDAVLSYLVTVRADDAAVEAREKSDPTKAGKAAGERLKKLIEQKRDAAAEEAALRYQNYEAGRGTIDILMDAYRRWISAERELTTDPKAWRKALVEYLDMMRKIEDLAKERFEAGKLPGQEVAHIRYFRCEAEQWLEEEKAK